MENAAEATETETKKSKRFTPVKTNWESLVALCKTCEGGEELADKVKKRWKEREFKQARLVRTSCMDVCPKHAVTCAILRPSGIETFVVADNVDAATLDAELLGRLGIAE